MQSSRRVLRSGEPTDMGWRPHEMNDTPTQTSLIPTTDMPAFPVDARSLHHEMGFAKDFSSWWEAQVLRHKLDPFIDYSPFRGESTGGRPPIEYRLTQHAARRIQIAARGEVGDAAREGSVRLYEHVEAVRAPTDDEIIAKAHEILAGRVKALTAQVAELAPRAEIADRLTAADGDMSLTDAARRLSISPRGFIARLCGEGILHGHVRSRRPRADLIKRGLFAVRSVEIGTWPDGSPRFEGQTMVTYSGLCWLAGRYERSMLPAKAVRP